MYECARVSDEKERHFPTTECRNNWWVFSFCLISVDMNKNIAVSFVCVCVMTATMGLLCAKSTAVDQSIVQSAQGTVVLIILIVSNT